MSRLTWIDPQLAQIPLFQDLSKKELRLVSSLATALELQAGKAITVEGRPGDEFVLIERGYVEIRKGDRVVATRGPGEYVGEIALIEKRPRTATVVALAPVSVAVIGRREFHALLDQMPELAARIHGAAAVRLAELEAQMRQPSTP